jgi:biopolymer transport protein ExbD
MRFPRNAKIFRGQLDFVPLANVLFLLVLFVLLCSLVYTPGISIQLQDKVQKDSGKLLSIKRSGDVRFEKKTYKVDDLQNLRDEFKKLPPDSIVILQSEAGAPRELILRVRELARVASVRLEVPTLGIDLPEGEGLEGTPNPTIAVAVTLGGQLFFENTLVTETDLKDRLTTAVQRSSEPLTLVIVADGAVQNETMFKLAQLARKAGIHKALIAGRSLTP